MNFTISIPLTFDLNDSGDLKGSRYSIPLLNYQKHFIKKLKISNVASFFPLQLERVKFWPLFSLLSLYIQINRFI